MENKKDITQEVMTPECSVLLPYERNQIPKEKDVYLQSSLPYCVRRFDFSFDKNNQMKMTMKTVQPGDIEHRYHIRLNGQSRERIMRENRKNVLNHKPFFEYVRFYKVIDKKKDTEWVGALEFDLMFLTLNSRFRVRKELKDIYGLQDVKLPVRCTQQNKLCRILSTKHTIKYIYSMNTRLPERRNVKNCLLDKLIPMFQFE
jgi:hypothetical protein